MTDKSKDYKQIAWDMAERAIKRRPHREWDMRSLDSTPPVYVFACDVCREVVHSFTSRPIPTCSGGSPSNFLDA